MNNDTVKMFRNAIGGFHRDDVTNYIKETDRKHADALAELTAQIEATERRNEELSARTEELQAEKDELAGQVSKTAAEIALAQMENTRLNAGITELETEKAALLEKLEALQNQLAEKDDALAEQSAKAEEMRNNYERQIAEKNEYLGQYSRKTTEYEEEKKVLTAASAEQEEKIAELTEKLQIAEASLAAQPEEPVYDPNDHTSPAYKLEMYDKISAQLGDILINANRNADDILNAAREEAEKIRMDTEIECERKRTECNQEVAQIRAETAEEAAYIRERLSGNAASMLSTVSADLHVNIENCIREMNDCVADMQYELQALLSKMTARSGEMNDRIGYYQNCVSEGIEKKLSDMDAKYGITKSADGELY